MNIVCKNDNKQTDNKPIIKPTLFPAFKVVKRNESAAQGGRQIHFFLGCPKSTNEECNQTDYIRYRKHKHHWTQKWIHKIHTHSTPFSVLLRFLHKSFKLKPGQSSSNGLLCFLSSVWVTLDGVQIAEVVSAVDNTQVKDPAMFHNKECQDTNNWSEVREYCCGKDRPTY